MSSLSFLGLGAQPPTPEWSAMFNDAKSVFLVAHALLAPGAAVTLAVLDANLLGNYFGHAIGGGHGIAVQAPSRGRRLVELPAAVREEAVRGA